MHLRKWGRHVGVAADRGAPRQAMPVAPLDRVISEWKLAGSLLVAANICTMFSGLDAEPLVSLGRWTLKCMLPLPVAPKFL